VENRRMKETEDKPGRRGKEEEEKRVG
jgi:hypothetical protein